MDVLKTSLQVISAVSIVWWLLESNTKPSVARSSKEDSLLETINFPEASNYKARIFARYSNKAVFEEAKLLVDQNYPFHCAPHGGTYYIARKREYYLNQYLWFYEQYKRFPYSNELITQDYFYSLSKLNEIKPATWFTLTNKNELIAEKLFRERLHLWVALKKSTPAESKELIRRCDKVDRRLTKLFTDDATLGQRRSKGVNHAS